MELRPEKFKLIAGDLSLDLVNTASQWQRTDKAYAPAGESIGDIADLISWALKANAIDEKAARVLAAKTANGGTQSLRRARKLRAAIYGLAVAVIDGKHPAADDLRYLDKERLRALERQAFAFAGGKFELKRRPGAEPLDAIIDTIALAAVELLTSDRSKRIRRCGGESCGWLFVDDSRGRNRHWCDMRDCGNLAKVRRFRKKAAKVAS
ncbi:MAG: hypothetical protein DYH05_11715 [Acidobacteria bacterium ACB1]|nr:hypothetical protein [Pyrinomonadaceae bacterium]MCE7963149.1 hypothetical protein [Acidobacteria bacterium ACB1]RIJ93899.1 MAG: hypothetical protein DCC44_06040 [Acidobacteriota bacterium]